MLGSRWVGLSTSRGRAGDKEGWMTIRCIGRAPIHPFIRSPFRFDHIAPPAPATEPISLIFWPHISPRTSSRPSPGKSSLAIDFFECIYQTFKYMRDWVGLLTWVDLAASPTMRLISNLHRALLVFVQPNHLLTAYLALYFFLSPLD